MIQSTQDSLTLRLGWTVVLDTIVLQAVLFAVYVPAFNAVVTSGSLDYRTTLVEVGALVTLVVLVGVARGLLQSRRPLILTAQGVGPLRWPEVTRMLVDQNAGDTHLWLYRETGPRWAVPVPRSSLWHPDRRFDRQVERIRAYALAHGAHVGPVERTSRRVTILILAGFTAVAMGAIGVQAVRRGVVLPWVPLASSYPASPCDALDVAGLDASWPASARVVAWENSSQLDQKRRTTCVVGGQSGTASQAPLRYLSLTIDVFPGDLLGSPISYAGHDYVQDERVRTKPVDLQGVGDEAFLSRAPPLGVAEARVANVIVTLTGDPGSEPLPVGLILNLLSGVAAQVHTS
jgi:hypothetical protein